MYLKYWILISQNVNLNAFARSTADEGAAKRKRYSPLLIAKAYIINTSLTSIF